MAGQIELHGELERKLANFLGTEDALILISGYLTNVSVISHLLARPDAVIYDSGAHNSIITGARLSGAQAPSPIPMATGTGWMRCWKRNAPASAAA